MAFECAQCGRLCLDIISYLEHIKRSHPELHRRMSQIFDFDTTIQNLKILRERDPEEWNKGMIIATQLIEYYFPKRKPNYRKRRKRSR